LAQRAAKKNAVLKHGATLKSVSKVAAPPSSCQRFCRFSVGVRHIVPLQNPLGGRLAPAMEAGIAVHIWSIKELVDLPEGSG
jgi:hypothetical protein